MSLQRYNSVNVYGSKKQWALYFVNYDLTDYYEGEIITQTMKEVQNRLTCTVGRVLDYFKDKDPSMFCGGSYLVSSDPHMVKCTGDTITCYEVLKPDI